MSSLPASSLFSFPFLTEGSTDDKSTLTDRMQDSARLSLSCVPEKSTVNHTKTIGNPEGRKLQNNKCGLVCFALVADESW